MTHCQCLHPQRPSSCSCTLQAQKQQITVLQGSLTGSYSRHELQTHQGSSHLIYPVLRVCSIIASLQDSHTVPWWRSHYDSAPAWTNPLRHLKLDAFTGQRVVTSMTFPHEDKQTDFCCQTFPDDYEMTKLKKMICVLVYAHLFKQ